MANILEQLGFKKRTHVGISLSANNFLELVCVDRATKSVIKYASGNVKYNNAIREIMDFDEFSEVVENLFTEAGLNPEECSVSLNLPNVHFGITSFESTYETPFIIENLQTEIEDLYIFKRNEPAISYSILSSSTIRNQQNIAFSAMQTKVIGRLVEIFDTLQADLVRIDVSYSSFLKALQYCDRFAKHFQKEEKTTIILVTPVSCTTFFLNGTNLADYTEEPIAVKSLSTEEVYSTITKIANNAISKDGPTSVLVVSETDEVNAETFASRIDFSGEIDFLNKSITASDNFIDITGSQTDIDSNMISYLTLEAAGAAVADYEEYPLNINFMPAERIDPNIIEVAGYEVNLYRFIIILFLITATISFLIGAMINFVLKIGINNYDNLTQKSETQMGIFKKNIDDNSKENKKNVFPLLKGVVDNNVSVLNAYTQLSTDIPDNVYIKKFVTNPKGGIGIIGEAKSSELVEVFVNRLREKNSDLMVSKFSVNSGDTIIPGQGSNNGLTFEIKTSNIDISLNDQDNLIQQAIQNIQNSGLNFSKRTTSGGSNTLPPPPVI